MSRKIEMTFEEAAEQRAEERYEQGIAKGELNNCRTLLCKLLENRFGQLAGELRQRIEASSDIENLRTCVEQVMDISSPDELKI